MLAAICHRLERSTPRVALGLALRNVARCGMDLSDGLAGDLPNILQASSQATGEPLGALLDESALLHLTADWAPSTLSEAARLQAALAGGDDYELLFTAPPAARNAVQAAAATAGVPVTRVGCIVHLSDASAADAIRLRDANGTPRPLPAGVRGFDYFTA